MKRGREAISSVGAGKGETKMSDRQCVAFLQWSLPQLRYQWQGFRKVRRQICKRLKRRIEELGLPDISEYRDYLSQDQREWTHLDSLLYISISRFYRDRETFDLLRKHILPLLALRATEESRNVKCWSAGCCSGEEAYTIQMIWLLEVVPRLRSPLRLHVVASDMTPSLLERARKGVYEEGSLRDVPQKLLESAFVKTKHGYEIKGNFRKDIAFVEQDIRHQCPEGQFDLIFCCNMAFTYFDEALQRETAGAIIEKLVPEGFLVVGIHESIPQGVTHLRSWGKRSFYQKIAR